MCDSTCPQYSQQTCHSSPTPSRLHRSGSRLRSCTLYCTSRHNAVRLPLLTVGFVPQMNNQPSEQGHRLGPVPTILSIAQHNCLRSWDIFLSLFVSFKEATTYPSIVLLQHPPLIQAHLPSCNGFKSFFPPLESPVWRPTCIMLLFLPFQFYPGAGGWMKSSPTMSPPTSLFLTLTFTPSG